VTLLLPAPKRAIFQGSSDLPGAFKVIDPFEADGAVIL